MVIHHFKKISIDAFLTLYKEQNPGEDLVRVRERLLQFKALRDDGEICDCGNTIWAIGSAFAGRACFTCITGETDAAGDFDVE